MQFSVILSRNARFHGCQVFFSMGLIRWRERFFILIELHCWLSLHPLGSVEEFLSDTFVSKLLWRNRMSNITVLYIRTIWKREREKEKEREREREKERERARQRKRERKKERERERKRERKRERERRKERERERERKKAIFSYVNFRKHSLLTCKINKTLRQ